MSTIGIVPAHSQTDALQLRATSRAASAAAARPPPPSVVEGVLGAIGNTPLVRIASLSAETGCEILGKAELLNPGGSVKDRVALQMVREAWEQVRTTA